MLLASKQLKGKFFLGGTDTFSVVDWGALANKIQKMIAIAKTVENALLKSNLESNCRQIFRKKCNVTRKHCCFGNFVQIVSKNI